MKPPSEEEGGLSYYVRTVRERLWILLAIVAVTTGVAVFYVATASEVYEAEANLLVNPAPSEAELLITLGLTPGSADPAREVQTVAQLVTSSEVSGRAKEALRGAPEAAGSPQSLLGHVTAEPIAESNLVAITADAGDPNDAAEIANAFAAAIVAERTDALLERIDATLEELRTSAGAGVAFPQRITQLETLRAQGQDPTLQVATRAAAPTAPAWPRPRLTVVGALLAGLVVGLGGIFALQTLDPRLRREEQLRHLYRLPILARIPKEKRASHDHPLIPTAVSAATAEAYRALRGALALSARRSVTSGRVIVVTGSAPSEGKTTTAINLAASLVAAGNRVLMVEADLRRPAIGAALDVKPRTGVVSVLLERTRLEDALVTLESHAAQLKLLLADYGGDWTTELFSLPAAERMVEEARLLVDYVIIDSPPLTDVVDALPLATYADDVLIVTRIGTTRLAKLRLLGELFAESGIRPAGFAVIGTKRSSESAYYHEAAGLRLFGASKEASAGEVEVIGERREAG